MENEEKSILKMKLPEGSGQVCWRGEVFKADKKGFVVVPAEAGEDLMSHGLTAVADEPDETDETKDKKKSEK